MRNHEQEPGSNFRTSNQEERGTPRQELTVQPKANVQEQGNLPAQQDWFREGMSHEQLVHELREFIEKWGRQLGGVYSREEIIRLKLHG